MVNDLREVTVSDRARGAHSRFGFCSLLFSFVMICAQALAFTSLTADQPAFVMTNDQPTGFALVHAGSVAPILVDSNDYPGVLRAAGDLQADVGRVTGLTPAIQSNATASATNIVLI